MSVLDRSIVAIGSFKLEKNYLYPIISFVTIADKPIQKYLRISFPLASSPSLVSFGIKSATKLYVELPTDVAIEKVKIDLKCPSFTPFWLYCHRFQLHCAKH